jgi:hypothetical protein
MELKERESGYASGKYPHSGGIAGQKEKDLFRKEAKWKSGQEVKVQKFGQAWTQELSCYKSVKKSCLDKRKLAWLPEMAKGVSFVRCLENGIWHLSEKASGK